MFYGIKRSIYASPTVYIYIIAAESGIFVMGQKYDNVRS